MNCLHVMNSLRHALLGEINDQDAILLDDTHEHEHADEGIKRSLCIEDPERQQSANQRHGQRREHGNGVQIILVKDRQNHVHHENGQYHEDR